MLAPPRSPNGTGDRNAAAPAATAVDIRELVKLARDKSAQARSNLATTISDLYFGEQRVLTDRDRALMTDILRQLIHDVEVSVRRAVSERLAEQPEAPRELVLALANDEIDVAYPILVRSAVHHRRAGDHGRPTLGR